MESLRAIANAILYEGYMLYPYRPSALKNQRAGWSFGSLLPPSYTASNPHEASFMAGEVLASRVDSAEFTLDARFLQLDPSGGSVERSVETGATLSSLLDHRIETPFAFGAGSNEVRGCARLSAEAIRADVVKISLSLHNQSRSSRNFPDRDAALQQGLIAAHAILVANETEFASLLDAPEQLRSLAAGCHQTGIFPVLVGKREEKTAMLFSPIILYDYPQIAPESPGDFFDSSEIDELLTLRVLTLTKREKEEIRLGSSRTRELLERTEATTPEDALKMHGVFRERHAAKEKL
jgi:hypothetical protein